MKKRDLVILVFLFIRFVYWSQSFSTIETRQICPSTSNSSVGKFQKLEFGFKLPQKIQFQIDKFLFQNDTLGINPFNPEQLNFEADFISPTGIITKRYGFYYQSFKSNEIFDRWEEDTTSMPWRLRFSPDEIGNWKVKINIISKLSEIPILHELYFNCTSSNHKGNLKISKTSSP